MKQLITIVLIVFAFTLFAEDWKVEADANLNLSQSAYSDNWAGEEKGSVTWTGNFNFLAEKQLTMKVNNKNTLKLAFGQTHNQYVAMNGDKKWAKPEKSTDLIDFESVFRFTLGAFVDPFAAFRLESQFMDQSVPDDVKSFNPMILTESFGIAKILIQQEKQELSTRLGAAFKQNVNSHSDSDLEMYGLIGNTNDGGIEFVTDYRNVFNDDTMIFTSKLNVYKAMFYSDEDNDPDDLWKAVDVAWENTLSATIYKAISLNLYFQMLYDEQIIDEVRFKETLGLGVTYKLL